MQYYINWWWFNQHLYATGKLLTILKQRRSFWASLAESYPNQFQHRPHRLSVSLKLMKKLAEEIASARTPALQQEAFDALKGVTTEEERGRWFSFTDDELPPLTRIGGTVEANDVYMFRDAVGNNWVWSPT